MASVNLNTMGQTTASNSPLETVLPTSQTTPMQPQPPLPPPQPPPLPQQQQQLTPFTPDHAETARLTEMALRSSIVGIVSSLLARIESSVEASVWRGMQNNNISRNHSSQETCAVLPPRPTSAPPPTEHAPSGSRKIKKAKRAAKRKLPRTNVGDRKRPRKQSDPACRVSPETDEEDSVLGALQDRGVSFDENSQQMVKDIPADFLNELAGQL